MYTLKQKKNLGSFIRSANRWISTNQDLRRWISEGAIGQNTGLSDAKGALSMTVPKKIEEVDIEVINLNLTQEERVVLSPVVNNI